VPAARRGEERQRQLRAWDFVHSPPWTEHIFVGAGDGPCAILMADVRGEGWQVRYPVSEFAAPRRERGEGGVEPGRGVRRKVRAVAVWLAVGLGLPAVGVAQGKSRFSVARWGAHSRRLAPAKRR
jgi:hypothetical protein